MRIALWVALGSGIGGVGRALVEAVVQQRCGDSFPFGVLSVNIAGSLAIGLIATITAVDGRVLMSPAARQFFLAGICGGFTTFSFFSLQMMQLLESGDYLCAGLYSAGTLLLSMAAVALGHGVGQKINCSFRG